MAVNIDTFKRFNEFVSNKTQSGGTLTTAQFNLIANQAQMQLFEKDYQNYILTGEVSDFLNTFLKSSILSVNSLGAATVPSDMEHISSMRHYYVKPNGNSFETEVKQVKNKSWGVMQASQLMAPTKRFPKYQERASEFLLLPKTVGSVTVDYFRTPVAPIWGFTTVNGRPVYDSSTSTDFEWSEFSLNNVSAMFLSLIGVNIKDGELEGFSNQFKQETNSTL